MSEILPNSRIGQYAIVSKIAKVGEVHRACDTKLGRDVATKVLRASLSENTDRLNHFKQEAQAADRSIIQILSSSITSVYTTAHLTKVPRGMSNFKATS